MSEKVMERKPSRGGGKGYFAKLWIDLMKNPWLYVMMIPGIIYFILFKYLPMWGIVIAFENYVPYSGVFGSQWVGFKWFEYFFNTTYQIFLNIHHTAIRAIRCVKTCSFVRGEL